MKISFVIPCHNEEKNVSILIPKIIKRYGKYLSEIIIVNDNSKDRTRQEAEKLVKKYGSTVKLINRGKPNGVGYAIREGILHVDKNSDWIMTMDADFLHNIGDIQKFIDRAGEGFDGVIGSRFLNNHSLVNYPFPKKVANRAYHFVLRNILGLKQKDVTNNFKLYKKEVFRKIKLTANDFAINAQTGILPILKGFKIAEVPVVWQERDHGKSKFAVIKVAPSYLKVFYQIMRERHGKSHRTL